MNRRSFIALTVAALVALPVTAQEVAQSQTASLKPYREVRTQPADAKKVLVFFAATCPVCAQYSSSLIQWGKTLPAGWTIEYIPVAIPDKGSVVSARAYYAVLNSTPNRIEAFMDASYSVIHDRGMNPNVPGTWLSAAKIAGVENFTSAWREVRQEQLETAYQRLNSYGVTVTPTLAIGGKFVITPDDTNGDANLFMQLANGMVSKAIKKN